MFDEFGPRGAEDEREGFWTDLSEVPDEQYRDEDEPKQTQEVIVPPAPAFLLGMGLCAMLCSFLLVKIIHLIGGDPDAADEESHDEER